ncbi:8-amino-7-oxononanoate synthase isoform X1 [Selaginella moellendorffii]|uniref:8-amino-7-oxononanoate synthase isoform X1 n=1 Tax=Selaginella moellendorffii TaxID=88036 RepID=UPI000D1C6D39|nr:8-amino-7-oxononanoate synthase isoform X1 [Selaginella moellendorffii]|eukprot:XP_024542140.1 8-amino-7-oxononanoate synthase isoform X1 [Selaginella moellendorffii]
MEEDDAWRSWLDSAIAHLIGSKVLRSMRTVSVASGASSATSSGNAGGFSDNRGAWEDQAVQLQVSPETFQRWIDDEPSTGESCGEKERMRSLIQFSGNDYLGLSMHPAVRSAASKAAIEFGMGPRGSALICGYTIHHRRLESAIASLKNTEECLLCPTGFAANMAVMTAISMNIPGFSSQNKIAIFSDELNHASIIDGVRVAQKQNNSEVYVYSHNNMRELESKLSSCKLERKVVVTDSLFSMDGDFAPLDKLVQLRDKYNFVLVIDDAHGTLVCGENGGGVAEAYGVEEKIDVYVGTLSKAFGCQGGFIATRYDIILSQPFLKHFLCSRKWKLLMQSRGRSFVFSTSLTLPVVAAAHAALVVASEEKWRRQALWSRVKQFAHLTGLDIQSPIVSVVIGSEKDALLASKDVLKAGFHVLPIRPPVVPPNSSRLRITLCASHTEAHVQALYECLAPWLSRSKTIGLEPLSKL